MVLRLLEIVTIPPIDELKAALNATQVAFTVQSRGTTRQFGLNGTPLRLDFSTTWRLGREEVEVTLRTDNTRLTGTFNYTTRVGGLNSVIEGSTPVEWLGFDSTTEARLTGWGITTLEYLCTLDEVTLCKKFLPDHFGFPVRDEDAALAFENFLRIRDRLQFLKYELPFKSGKFFRGDKLRPLFERESR